MSNWKIQYKDSLITQDSIIEINSKSLVIDNIHYDCVSKERMNQDYNTLCSIINNLKGD